MGAVTFGLDERFVRELSSAQPLECFVETGTFRGDTVASMLPYFNELISMELSEPLYVEATARFASNKKVRMFLGNSPDLLGEIRDEVAGKSVLFWLDAHWCASEESAGLRSQCPLLEELRALKTINENSVLMIDDARLFLAPPPYPHEISQWPSFHSILDELANLSALHKVLVVNDVIVYSPMGLVDAVVRYARRYGVDWLAASQSLDVQTDYEQQLKEKEAVLQDLSAALSASRILIERQNKAFTENEEVRKQEGLRYERFLEQKEQVWRDGIRDIELLRELLAEKEKTIVDLHAQVIAANDSAAGAERQRLQLILEEKEQVIQTLARALRAYRAVFQVGRLIWRGPARIWEYFKRGFAPRLGRLYQHPPQSMSKIVVGKCRIDGAQLPRISLVTPSFQQGRFIARTIASVVDQRYPSLEYLIQDGGSTDGTEAAVQPYLDQLSGWESTPDSGQSDAINRGLARTNGEIMAWLNSDDLLLPGALCYVGEFFARNPDVDVIYGHRLIIDVEDKEVGRWVLPSHSDSVLAWADFVPQETLFWRRRVWDRGGGRLDESFRFAMDWDLLLRFRSVGAKMVRVPRFLGAFRVHEAQKTSAAIAEVGFEEMKRLRERVHGREVNDAEIRRAILPYLLRHVLYHIGYSLRSRIWNRSL